MESFSDVMRALVAGLAVGPFFWAVAVLLFVYVTTVSYRAAGNEPPQMQWPRDETPLAEVHVSWLLTRSRTILTNHRLLQWRVSWLLAKWTLRTIALRDVRSVSMRRHMNWLLLLAGAYFIGKYTPVALALILIGMQARLHGVRAGVSWTAMPYDHVVVRTPRRAQWQDLQRFYQKTQAAWAEVRAARATASTEAPDSIDVTAAQTTDFSWGRPVLACVFGLMMAALLQRTFASHIHFDNYLFTPLYLGLPIAVACRSLRDGLWVAALGLVGILAVKFPGSGLVGFIVADGGAPAWAQYASALITSLTCVVAAHVIAWRTSPLLAPAALLLWIPFIAIQVPGSAADLSVYSRLALAMAAAIGLTMVDEQLATDPQPTVPAVTG